MGPGKMKRNVALEPGNYIGFTGYVNIGGTEGYVENATFEAVLTGYGDALFTWSKGVWINGTAKFVDWFGGEWRGGSMTACIWYDGTWNGGTFENGDWYNGEWQCGTFLGSRWLGGTWFEGDFNGSTWYDGTWLEGTWTDSTYVDRSRAGNKVFRKVLQSTWRRRLAKLRKADQQEK